MKSIYGTISKSLEDTISHAKYNYCEQARFVSSHSSNLWLERQRKDEYCKQSRYDNYRARSAYKLIQIDDKYKLLRPGQVVLDVGAAPGSWTQVICERLKLVDGDATSQSGVCLAIDINPIQPVKGAICLGKADFTLSTTQDNIIGWLGERKVDCILSDMAPAASGHKFLDHTRIVGLVKSLLPFSHRILKPGGVLLAKIWCGESKIDLVNEMKGFFDSVRDVKPPASRTDSSEIYVLCRGYRKNKEIGLT